MQIHTYVTIKEEFEREGVGGWKWKEGNNVVILQPQKSKHYNKYIKIKNKLSYLDASFLAVLDNVVRRSMMEA